MIDNEKIKFIALKAFEAIHTGKLTGNQDADNIIENLIFNELKSLNVDMKIVSEESGTLIIGDPDITIVIDPIDGTGNVIRGIPIYSVAIAVCKGLLDKVTLNDIQYSVIVSTFGIFENSCDDIDTVNSVPAMSVNEALLRYVRPFRNRLLGASTVELCLLAQGSIDGFIEAKGLKNVDLIPTLLILKKSGCYFSDKDGNDVVFDLNDTKANKYSFLAARSKELHEGLVDMMKEGVTNV